MQRALAINPNSVPALETYGQLLLMNGREEEGLDYFTRVLALNPESLKTLSVLASKAALEERSADYDGYLTQVEAFSPNNPRFLGDVADSFGNNYRFTEAVGFARALGSGESTPGNWYGMPCSANSMTLNFDEPGMPS